MNNKLSSLKEEEYEENLLIKEISSVHKIYSFYLKEFEVENKFLIEKLSQFFAIFNVHN
jgi:hypothetical protein